MPTRNDSASDDHHNDGQQAAAERKERDDRDWDGNWLIQGLSGMFVGIDTDDFLENQLEIFRIDLQASKVTLRMEEEFLNLDTGSITGPKFFQHEENLEEFFTRLQTGILQPRNLHLADGVLRRLVEGRCPPLLRIRRIPNDQFREILDWKRKGNEAFANKEFQQAIDHYQEALLVYTDDELYVAPTHQIEQIVNILSNQAECYLRLKEYQDAGYAATNALLFNNSHEKSRMRRAKAEVATGGLSFVLQAQKDLEEIICHAHTKTGVHQAKEYLRHVKDLVQKEKRVFHQEYPNQNWDLVFERWRSKCW